MAIDLSTPEGRSSYLNDKLSDLINGVDSTYGNLIFDELLKRIDKTIKDFNAEMDDIFDDLLKGDLNDEIFYFKNERNFLLSVKKYLETGNFYTRTKKNSKNYLNS